MIEKPQSLKIACSGCSSEAVTGGGNTAKIESETGFYAIIKITTEVVWLCPSCTDRVIALLRPLVDLVRDPDVHRGRLGDMLSRMEAFRRPAGEDST